MARVYHRPWPSALRRVRGGAAHALHKQTFILSPAEVNRVQGYKSTSIAGGPQIGGSVALLRDSYGTLQTHNTFTGRHSTRTELRTLQHGIQDALRRVQGQDTSCDTPRTQEFIPGWHTWKCAVAQSLGCHTSGHFGDSPWKGALVEGTGSDHAPWTP
jgi:hypothetical protein